MRRHLAIMDKQAIEAILSGRKTIETRFSKHKIAPFKEVSVGDVVYIKPPGEEIIGQFRVNKVISYEGLTPLDIEKIFADYSFGIRDDNIGLLEYKKRKKESSFASLIFIGESERFITAPIKVKKRDLRGWMVIDNIKT